MTLTFNLADPNVTPEMIVEKLMELARPIVKPTYYRFQISGRDMDDVDYPTIEAAKEAAQKKYDQEMDEDTPDDARNNEEFTEDATITAVTYDENEDEVFGEEFMAEVTWTYYHGDYAEHNTYW